MRTATIAAARTCLLIAVLFAVMVGDGRAAENPVPERRGFEAARVALEDGLYDYADKKFSEFLTAYPESPLLPEVRLFLAQSRFHLKDYGPALALLQDNVSTAGNVADEYQFWMAEILNADGKLDLAESAYGELIAKYPDSKLVLSAAFKQAYAFYRKQDYQKTVALLSSPEGAFERARQKERAALPSLLGVLLLADSQYSLKEFAAAEQTLGKLPETALPSEPDWQRLNLTARILQATDRVQPALDLMPAVLAAAEQVSRPEALAESHSLRAGILEQLDQKTAAIEAYKPNLNPDVGESWRRQALVKTVELSREAGSAADAIAQLELLSSGQLDEPARDLVQLTLGELQLKQMYALPYDQREPGTTYSPAASNFLSAAQANFNNVITGFTNSPYLGKAWMNRAWCDWQFQRWEAAAASFSNATLRLPPGLDHAVAIFKQGDAQFKLQRFEDALLYYNRLVTEYGENKTIKGELLDQVYYQIIQSGIAASNLDAAIPAMQALMGQFPGSFYADRSLLLVGQALNDIRNPAGARKVFEGFSNRFTGSSLEPEVQLAIARTYELEANWTAAAEVYGSWITNHTNHASKPTAMFGEAWALSKSGGMTNAFAGFTNFVAAYPAHDLTPGALQWLGDQFYSAKDYPAAELYYQRLFTGTNWPASRTTFQARVLAGRAALGRQAYSEAKRYLTNLLNIATCPEDIYAGALYAYGDVLMSEPSENSAKFVDARGAFDRLVSVYANSVDVPAAWGRIGDCNFQLKLYSEATIAYRKCLEHPLASIHERSQAEVKWGKALEKFALDDAPNREALLDQAMERYLNVFLQMNVNEEKQEKADPYWVQRAGMDAAALAESQQKYDQAARLYRRLREMLPQLGAFLDQRIRQQETLARRNGG